jgi:hypothetical protein
MRDESNEMTTSRPLVEVFVTLSLESIDVSSLVQIAARKITVEPVRGPDLRRSLARSEGLEPPTF